VDGFPAEPEVPPEQRGVAEGRVRYEDIAQDGRLTLLALPHSYGLAVWQALLVDHPMTRPLQRDGVMPILTKLVLEGGEGPLSVRKPIEMHGCYQLGHTVDESAMPDRILLDMWTRLYAPRSRTVGPPPPGAGERILVGRCFAEHVFTRLFAPPESRKVLRLEVPGADPVPRTPRPWRAPDSFLQLPRGAVPLDEELVPDDAEVVFGVAHTDSNQHVNSLVYPRLFEDAAVRRLAARGVTAPLLGRRVEVGYRKPCFAGERLRLLVRSFRLGGGYGAVGTFQAPGAARPHVTLRLLLEP
jgi:hypothetical protein